MKEIKTIKKQMLFKNEDLVFAKWVLIFPNEICLRTALAFIITSHKALARVSVLQVKSFDNSLL